MFCVRRPRTNPTQRPDSQPRRPQLDLSSSLNTRLKARRWADRQKLAEDTLGSEAAMASACTGQQRVKWATSSTRSTGRSGCSASGCALTLDRAAQLRSRVTRGIGTECRERRDRQGPPLSSPQESERQDQRPDTRAAGDPVDRTRGVRVGVVQAGRPRNTIQHRQDAHAETEERGRADRMILGDYAKTPAEE